MPENTIGKDTSIRLKLQNGVEVEIKTTITRHNSGEILTLDWDMLGLADYFMLEERLKEAMEMLLGRANAKSYRAMVARQPVKPANKTLPSNRFKPYSLHVDRLSIDDVVKCSSDNRVLNLLQQSKIEVLSPEDNFEFLKDIQENILDIYFDKDDYLEWVLPDYDERFVRSDKEYDIDNVIFANVGVLKNKEHAKRIIAAEWGQCLMEVISPLVDCYKIKGLSK